MAAQQRPLRLLSLDGGGIRGLSTILILKHIMANINLERPDDVELHPWQAFDMIAGTSTGGLLAVMLGRLRMTLDECEDAYLKLAEDSFQAKRYGINIPWRVKDFWDAGAKFNTESLEIAIRKTIAEREKLPCKIHGCEDACDVLLQEPQAPCKVFVCAVQASDSHLVALRSYKNPKGAENNYKTCKIWEACRATSAATTFFDPIKIGRYGVEYVDGGIKSNNPVHMVHLEARQMWPTRMEEDQQPILISIGTGEKPGPRVGGNIIHVIDALKEIVTASDDDATKFQNTHERMVKECRHFRFTVTHKLTDISLEEWEKTSEIYTATTTYLDSPHVRLGVERCVDKVKAALFEESKDATSKDSRVYSVLLETVPSYVERRQLSLTIEEKLLRSCETSSNPLALVIHGLGGTGKTQLALNFIENRKSEYDPILWIDAKNPETVRSSFERCASDLLLEVGRATTQESALKDSPAVKAVLSWLRGRKDSENKWLVVVDNADDFSWGLKDILPKGKLGAIIVTSQDRYLLAYIKGCEEVQVDTMEPSESKALLLRHLGHDCDSASDDVQHTCQEIASQLGHLALAVDLAGASVRHSRNRNALKQYLTHYMKHRDKLLRSMESCNLSSYEKTVWTVWDTTLEIIEREYPHEPAGLLLAFLARFNPGAVQDELFRLASLGVSAIDEVLCTEDQKLPDWLKSLITLDEDNWDSFPYEQALKPLIRYGLVQQVDGEWPGVTMHNLVQWRAMKYREDQQWDIWYLVYIVAGCYQLNREAANPRFRRHVMPHLSRLNQSCSDAVREDEGRMFVWDTIGQVYNAEGWWKEAKELFVQVIETSSRVLGEEHPSTLTSMANLASTYRNQGRWKEAKELFVQVVETSSRVLGEEHPSTLTSMANLASTFWSQGQWKEAKELFIQVIETSSRVLGEEHPCTLTSMANLASTLWNQGRWNEAEELDVQVIETRKRVLGEGHPSTLTSIANLASTYRNQGRWKETEELDVQVMETRKRVLGEEHPDTLTSIANLALTYGNQGRWKEAEELDVQVIETKKRVLGEEHPSTLTSISNLASIYSNQGRWKEAKELEVQVIDTSLRVLGEEHPSTLASMANLASTYRNQGRWNKAEELDIQVIEIRKRVLGEEHPSTLTSIANLASTYRNQGRWNEAEELDALVKEMSLRVLGEEHPDTLTIIANLASTFWNQGRWKEAEELDVQVIDIRKRVLGEEHLDTLTSMANLASTYRNQGRWKEAEELDVQVMEIRKRVLGEEHPDTLTSMDNLASTYRNQERWKEAEELDVQVIDTRKRVLGEEHPSTLTSMNNLAFTFKSQGRNDEAISLMENCFYLRKQVQGLQHPYTKKSFETLNKWRMENIEA